MGLKKISLSAKDKEDIQSVYTFDLKLKNTFTDHEEIQELAKGGTANAQIYLSRNKLGQRLSLFDENNLYKAVVHIQHTLQLKKPPRRIECYDISHLSGSYVYGSMVTCIDGRMEKKLYRLFKCKHGNNDFENHKEVLTRRFKKHFDNPENKAWSLPELIIVDGGKGQLSGNEAILQSFNLQDSIAIAGLAKREEEVFLPAQIHESVSKNAKTGKEGGILFDGQAKFLLQRIRDEAHRFAITNNRKARARQASKSKLDDIPGVGDKTKQKILTHFGSFSLLIDTIQTNKELVIEVIGYTMYKKIVSYFKL